MSTFFFFLIGGGQIWPKQLAWQRFLAWRCTDWCIVTDRRVVFVGVSVCARSKGETDALPAVLQRTGLLLSDSCSRSGRHTTALQVGEPPPRKKTDTYFTDSSLAQPTTVLSAEIPPLSSALVKGYAERNRLGMMKMRYEIKTYRCTSHYCFPSANSTHSAFRTKIKFEQGVWISIITT